MEKVSSRYLIISKKKFWIFSSLLVLTRILDGVTTWLATPDLKDEQNFVIRNFGLGWNFVLFLGFFVIIIMLILLQFGYKKQNKLIISNPCSLKYYAGKVFYGKDSISIVDVLINIKFEKAFFVLISLLIPISFIYYSLFLIVNNLFMYVTYIWKSLDELYVKIHFIFNPLNAIVLVSVIAITFFRLLKKGYLVSKSSN